MYKIDRLIERIEKLGNPSVVGLDPTLSIIPPALRREATEAGQGTPDAIAEIFLEFNKAIIDAIADIVPAVKPQIAMYESYGIAGIACYAKTTAYAASKGLYVIGDIKRGDISSTAAAYAAHLTGPREPGAAPADPWHEDAITVNPYFGADGIKPFTDACATTGKSIFILVKTSNKSSAEIQDLPVSEGGLANNNIGATPVQAGNAKTEALYKKVGKLVELWGADLRGEYGYSAVGAVVGATHPEIGQALRQIMPHSFFLVPGYGAQGASAKDISGFFDAKGRGCIVNSSRGIIAAWQETDKPETPHPSAAPTTTTQTARNDLKAAAWAARQSAIKMRDDLKAALNAAKRGG